MKRVTTVNDFITMAGFLMEHDFPATAEIYIKEGFEGIYLIVEDETGRKVFKM